MFSKIGFVESDITTVKASFAVILPANMVTRIYCTAAHICQYSVVNQVSSV